MVSRRSVVFVDPISDEECALYVQGPNPSFFDGKSGVAHPRCNHLADVSADLDAFYCKACGRNGRISGGWAIDVLRSVRGEPDDEAHSEERQP